MTLPVLHLNQILTVSGASKVMENLAALTDRQRFQPMLAGIDADASHVAHLRARGIPAARLGLDLSGLRELVAPGQPFAVVVHRSGHQQDAWDTVIPALKQAGAVTVLERSIFGYPDQGPGGSAVDVHVSNSMNTLRRDWIARGRPRLETYLDTHRVIYNPVVIDPSLDLETLGRALRVSLGIPQDAFVVSTLTRPDPHKLDSVLAQVFPRLHREREDAYLIARRLPDAIAKPLAKACGQRFVNLPTASSAEDVLATLAASDAMVHMSTIGESFGMAIAEAMRLGKPVITNETRQLSKSNAQGELIRHGHNGYLFNDSYSVYRQLVALADDPALRRAVGAAANQRFASGPLSPEYVIQQWQRTISEALPQDKQIVEPNNGPSSRVPTDVFRAYLAECDGPPQTKPYVVPLKDLPWATQADLGRWCFRAKRRLAA